MPKFNASDMEKIRQALIDYAYTVDGEFGNCRDRDNPKIIDELFDDGELPPHVVEWLKAGQSKKAANREPSDW